MTAFVYLGSPWSALLTDINKRAGFGAGFLSPGITASGFYRIAASADITLTSLG